MASVVLSRPFLLLLLPLLAFFSRISISEAQSSFSFTSSGKNASFESDDITLYGGAKLVDGGSSIQLSHGDGRVLYKKPIEYVETKSDFPLGFSTVFSFSIAPGSGGRLGFVVFPVNGTLEHSLIQVKFDVSEDFIKLGDSNVTVIVDGTTVPETSSNFTIVDLETEKKEMLLYARINYFAGGQFLEVRLSKSESFESIVPLMFTRIDLRGMLKDEGEFMVGVNSYTGNFSLHSWSLEARRISKGVHSYAALLEAKRREEEAAKRRREDKVWETVTCFLMTFGSIGLVFFGVMHIWAAFKRNNLAVVMPEERGLKTKGFEYEKMEKMGAVMSSAEAKQERK